jgi:hypothetical protein
MMNTCSALIYVRPIDPEELIAAVEKLKSIINTEIELRAATLLKDIGETGKQSPLRVAL